MNKTTKIALVCTIVFLCVVCIIRVLPERITQPKSPHLDPHVLYTVEHVIDGDTFILVTKQKHLTVRMLGIDTPETVDPRKSVQCYGLEASQKTKSLLEGHSVRLVTSPQREVLDKYGRYLAYVYRDDDMFINEHLLEGGFAREYTYGTPYSLQKEFRNIEKEAMHHAKGLWGHCKEVVG